MISFKPIDFNQLNKDFKEKLDKLKAEINKDTKIIEICTLTGFKFRKLKKLIRKAEKCGGSGLNILENMKIDAVNGFSKKDIKRKYQFWRPM